VVLEKVSWADRVKNETVLHVHRVEEERDIVQIIKEGRKEGRKAN
jgi:hypothetical protein